MSFKRASGILLHPSSLPGPYGIGDMGKNAFKFIDLLKKSGQKIWQVLPLGPTSFGDSPYQSFSAFAGNQLLINPEILMEKKLITNEDLNNIPEFSEKKIDFENVIKYKNKIFRIAFENFNKDNNEYINFCKENSFWLNDYSLFISLKYYFIEKRKYTVNSEEFLQFKKLTEKFLTEKEQNDYFYGAVWSTWPKELAKREQTVLSKISVTLSKEIDFIKFLQFEFFSQWKNLKNYANENGIKIIGDMPIFVSYDSADVWSENKYFDLYENGFPKNVAGVPPDYFSKTGQLWGNPLYNWDIHKKECFSWWIRRVKHSFDLADYLRIDHFRGFESFWKIPLGSETAINGSWEAGPGKVLFDEINKELGKVNIIAEDLGIITKSVKELKEKTGFAGMKVLQFAFTDTENNDYLPHNYEKNSVVYTGTHDNDTTKGWYETASEFEKDKYRRYLNVSGENPSWDLIRLASSSCADIAVFPFSDVLMLDSSGRMNTPGTISGNWQWRFTWEMVKDDYINFLKYTTNLFDR